MPFPIAPALRRPSPSVRLGDAVGYAGFDDNRRLDLPAIRGEGDDVAGDEPEPCCLLRIERQCVAPYLLGQRLRTFLQPRIVGERAVPQAWIGPQHHGQVFGRRRGGRQHVWKDRVVRAMRRQRFPQ